MLCFQAEDGIRDLVRSRGLGDVYKRQTEDKAEGPVDITLRTLSPTGSRTTFLDSLISNERLSLIHI